MRCVGCSHADAAKGTTAVTLERGGMTLVVNSAPARVCPNCGNAYVDEPVAAGLLKTAEEVSRAEAHIEIRQYAAV